MMIYLQKGTHWTDMKKTKTITKTKKSSYHHDDLRSALVKEALLFIKSHSADELSLRDLARRLKVSHMAPYRHFKTKEDLLAAIIENGFLRMTAMFDEIKLTGKTSFIDTLAFYGKAYVRFMVQNSDQARLMFSGLLCDPQKFPTTHSAGMGTFGRLANLIKRGQDEGHVRKKDDPMMISLMIWSSIHGTAMLMLEDQFKMIDNAPEVQMDIFVQFMAERLIKGLQ